MIKTEGLTDLAGHKMEVFGELQDLHEARVFQLAGPDLRSLLSLEGRLLLLRGLEARARHGLPPLIC